MKRDEEEKLERLIEEKSFQQLTPEQKVFVIQMLGSEEEFEMLQRVEKNLIIPKNESQLEPNPNTLPSLKNKLRENMPRSAWYSILNQKIPAYATVLLMIISFVFAGWIAMDKTNRGAVAASTVFKTDTVYFSKIDTVFRERVVYRQASIKPPVVTEIQTAKALEKVTPASSGVSMKDKEELNKLLVSGSDD